MLDQITPLIITYNEEANLHRSLEKMRWAAKIIVVDSGSTDETLAIVRAFPNATAARRTFHDFASQCNFGLTLVQTPWVLSLDADYELSDELVAELKTLVADSETAGFRARFVYRIYGRPLRGSLYPPRVVLYRKDRALYHNEGHGHRVSVAGKVVELGGTIFHDDRKSLARWISSQQRYARDEARYLMEMPDANKTREDRLRLMGWPGPLLVVLYTLLYKGCIFDGWIGWHYALQRLCAEVLLALEIVDRRLRKELLPP